MFATLVAYNNDNNMYCMWLVDLLPDSSLPLQLLLDRWVKHAKTIRCWSHRLVLGRNDVARRTQTGLLLSLSCRTPPQNNRPPNMAAANFALITNGEGCARMEQPLPQSLSTNSVPRAFFSRVAIGCRLSLKIDRNLSPFWAGGLSVVTWYDTAWIGGTASGEYLYRSVYEPLY